MTPEETSGTVSTPQSIRETADVAILEPTAAEPPAPAAAPRALPVQPQERVAAVDVLRGVALMGILAMNVVLFAWPDSCYDSPRAGNNTSVVDLVDWAFNHVVFDEKMMTIFSMLFGAGLVLMSERSDARGASLTAIYYRRVFWLLMIGLAHAYLIWHGDILVLYAESGFLLYLFRHRSPRTLITLGLLCLLLPVVLGVYLALILQMSQEQYWGMLHLPQPILAAIAGLLSHKVNPDLTVSTKEFAESLAAYRGGYLGIIAHRAPNLLGEQTIAFLFVTLWMVGGRMLLGMGLMKLDVFSARRSPRFYRRMVLFGYGIGLPLVAYDTWLRIANDFRGVAMIQASLCSGYLSAIAIALGHVGVVMLVYQSGAVRWLTSRLAAAGRMALTNYLLQSILCTTLFYGYGAGYFGYVRRAELKAVVLSIWLIELFGSILWLRFFRYGPAEWLWRSLTYWKLQPMLVRVPIEVPLLPTSPSAGETPLPLLQSAKRN